MSSVLNDPLAAAEAAALRDAGRQAGETPAPKRVQAPRDLTAGQAPRLMPDVSTGEIIGAGATAEAVETDYWWLDQRRKNAARRTAIDKARELGIEMPRPKGPATDLEGAMFRDMDPYTDMWSPQNSAALLRAREENPAAFADLPITEDEISSRVNTELKAEWQDAQDTLGAAPGGFFDSILPEFLGRMGTAATDEINAPIAVGTLGVSTSAQLGRLMLMESGLAVAGEAATLPKMYDVADRLGTPEPNAPVQLAFAAAVGAAVPAVIRGAQRGLGKGISIVEGAARRDVINRLREDASSLAPEERAALNAMQREQHELDTTIAEDRADGLRETDAAADQIDNFEAPSDDVPAVDPARLEERQTPPPAPDPDGPEARGGEDAPPPRPVETSIGALLRDAEARGSYDTASDFSVIAPPQRLTNMTLDEVDAWQAANQQAGAQSTAAGGYQIIRDTLRSLRADLQLDGSEVFDEALQDRMARELMRRRGLDEFLAGDLSADEFADRMAQEWAALPMPDGRSFYAGDGLNAATIRRDQFLSILTGEEYTSTGRAAPRMGRVRASTVQVDPRTYQFRTEVDAQGVGTPMDRVSQWDEMLAGDFIVHDRLDGSRFIADGHHRKQLADRLEAEGQPPVEFNAFVLREADGYSVEHVRAIAAVKNIEQGNASAVDAAKVLRVDPAMLERLTLRSSQARDARGLMQLSDEAFDMVTNGQVREDMAAFVPSLTRDPVMQEALLRALIRVKPKNMAEARQIAADAHRAGLAQRSEADRNQQSLFGDDFDPTETLFKERAEVMARMLAQLRNDRRVFATLVRESDRITEAGNALTQDTNTARLTADETALGLIERLANRAGPLDDALNHAARTVRTGGSVRNAVTELLGYVRGELEGGGFGRLLDGEDGSPPAGAGPDAPTPESAARADAEGPDTQADLDPGPQADGATPEIREGFRQNRIALAGLKKGQRVQWVNDGFNPPRTFAGTITRIERKSGQGTVEVKNDSGGTVSIGARLLEPEAEAPAAPPARATETTNAGDQVLMEGVAPITARDRTQAAQDAPMRGGDAPLDRGLFDTGARDQVDMFDAPAGRDDLFADASPTGPDQTAQADAAERALREAVARGEDFAAPTGRMVDNEAEMITVRDALDELDTDAEFIEALNICTSRGPKP